MKDKITRIVCSHHIEYRNEKGQFHRLDGPARIFFNGNQYWYKNDLHHRESGPSAVDNSDGWAIWWYEDGKYARSEA